ncbi:olfactory receptor 1L4-like [Ambystoma mexicanum]|uniref:olfactory receptor 1L4-like n=1 Tax=Ambystoma mexicanum TaxID=8296 RepID=UPI0037E7934C
MDSFEINQTSEFILVGFSSNSVVKALLFVMFLIVYLITLLGDTYIITLVALDPNLHNPMYFFLANFSFVDICLTSVIVPQYLSNLSSTRQTISFAGCFTQLFFFLFTANMEFFLLAVMGYDRYVAICNPFQYHLMMRRQICCQLLIASWVITILHALLYTLMTSRLSFCASNWIHHFFCDVPPLLKLTCSNISTYQLVTYTEAVVMILGPFLSIMYSYAGIILTILKIRSVKGRHKAFSTCSSHLTLVGLLYGSVFFMYFRPPSKYALNYDMVVSVVYTLIIPMLNPFIYSLRNKDMKRALQKLLGRLITCKTFKH